MCASLANSALARSSFITSQSECEEEKGGGDVKLGAVSIDAEMAWLRRMSVQCTLSRWLYAEEFAASLKQCVVDHESEVYKQLAEMHEAHVAN